MKPIYEITLDGLNFRVLADADGCVFNHLDSRYCIEVNGMEGKHSYFYNVWKGRTISYRCATLGEAVERVADSTKWPNPLDGREVKK